MQSEVLKPPLAQGLIDRDADTRMRPAALDLAWSDPSARALWVRGNEVFLSEESLALQKISGRRDDDHWYLGRLKGAPIFAKVLGAEGTALGTGGSWASALTAGTLLRADEAELVAMAVALQHWHASAKYSPRDGSLTEVAHAGWARIEPATGVEHFPRTDPAAIVLIVHDDRVLLGSNVLWETGRFSLLAGFVEAGESAEQAARREVLEESGVRIGRLDYLGSQPWPFPRSLMLGYRGYLADGQDPAALQADPEEIAELRWFTRAELQTPGDGVKLPRSGSIARWIIDRWIAEGDRSNTVAGGLGGPADVV